MGESEQITVLLPRHKAMLKLMVRGWRIDDAALELGYDIAKGRVIAGSPVFKEELERQEKDFDEKVVDSVLEVKGDLKRACVEAVRVLKESMKAQSESVRINAAKDILDRAGVMKEEKLRVNALVEASQSFVNMLARALREGKVEQSDTDRVSTDKESAAEPV